MGWDEGTSALFNHPAHVEFMLRWMQGNSVVLEDGHWRGHGNTSAQLAAIYVTRPEFHGKTIMKYLPTDRRDSAESGLHRQVWERSPKAFRSRHLVEPLWDALPLPNLGWLQFQAVARDDLNACTTLHELIIGDAANRKIIDGVVSVVSGILGEWNEQPSVSEPEVVGTYLRNELGFRLGDDGTVRRWAVQAGLLTPDDTPLPFDDPDKINPLALVFDAVPAATAQVRIRRGFAHRDAHPGNVLLTRDDSDFVLVDLSRAGDHEPLAADPAYLLLTTLAYSLPQVASPLARASLADLIVTRTPNPAVPPHLGDLASQVYAAAQARLGVHGMGAEWDAEYQLALIVAALTIAGRDLDPESRRWFGDLAARAAKAVTESKVLVTPGAATRAALVVATPRATTRALEPPRARSTASWQMSAMPTLPIHMVDRTELPSEFRDLAPSAEGWVMALHGPPSAGKTYLAATYAHRHAGDYSGVMWLSAGRVNPLGEQLAEYASGLGLPPAANSTLLRSELFAYLSANGPWLVVLDEAPDAEAIGPFVPRVPGVDVLITSRDPRWTRIASRCAIGGFTTDEAMALFTRILGEMPGLAELAIALDLLPGAVVQAAHYLADSTLTPERFRELLLAHPVETLSEVPGSLAGCWSIALDSLAQRDRRAVEMLEVAAFFGQGPIPTDLLAAIPASVYPELGEVAANPLSLDQVIRTVVGTGLLQPSAGNISLLPLFQSFVRHRVATERPMFAARSTLARCAPGDPGDPQTWSRFHHLLTHILAADLTRGDADCRALLLATIRYLVARRDLETALSQARTAVDRWTATFGADAEPTLMARSHLAHAHFHNGDTDTALGLDQEVADTARRVLGPDAPMTLAADRDAAATAMATRPQSGHSFRDILTRYLQRFGPNDPDTLRVAHNRAYELRRSHRLTEARELEQDTYTRMRTVLGEHHVDTLRSGHALAQDLRAAGDHTEARLINDLVHHLRRETLGAQHPDTAQSAVSLAEDMRRAGELPAARTLLEPAHSVLVDTLGVDDPLTLLAAHGLCMVLARLGEPAADLAEDTLVRRVRVLGVEDLDTLRTRSVLADLLAAEGSTERAETERAAVAAALARHAQQESTTQPSDPAASAD